MLETNSLYGEKRAMAKKVALADSADKKVFDVSFSKIGPSCLGFTAFMLIRDVFDAKTKIGHDELYRVAKVGERLIRETLQDQKPMLFEALFTASAAGYLARAGFLRVNAEAIKAVSENGEKKRAVFAKKFPEASDQHARIVAEIQAATEINSDLKSALGDFKIEKK